MRRLTWSILAIVCFAVSGLLLSRPAEASTWRALPSVSYDCYSADFVDAYRGWIGGTNWREDMLIEDLGLISRTDSGGEAWQESGTWTFLNVTDLDFIDHSRGWAVLDDGTILATASGGSTWIVQAEGSFDFRDNNWTYESLSMADASHGCAVGSWVGLTGVSFPRIVYTTDGSEWKAADLPNLPGAHLEAVHMADAQSGWAVGSAGPGDLTPLILVTHDGGVTWVRQTGGLPSNGARLHGVWFVDGEHGWAVGDLGAVYATSDGGITWESQTSGTSAALLDVSFADPATGWAVGEGGIILETVEAGDPWVQQSSGTDEALRAVTSAGGSVWAAGDEGVVLTAAGVPGTGFTDIDSSPYRLAIASLAAAGIVNGFDDGTFRPNATMTRQQFAKVIALTLGLEVVDGFQPYPFTDVPRVENDPYPDDYIAVCAANGITQGTDPVKKLFSPYDPVTRAQVITMVVRAADAFQPGRLAYPPPGYDPTWGTFDSTHAANAARAEYNQLLEGLPLALLDPFGPIPRGEVAQILSNFLGLF